MIQRLLAFAAVVAFAGTAVASDGGKVPWNKDPKTALKDAKKSGKAMMMFFTSDG